MDEEKWAIIGEHNKSSSNNNVAIHEYNKIIKWQIIYTKKIAREKNDDCLNWQLGRKLR